MISRGFADDTTTMREYFGVDARGVRWAHAVNSRAELAAALADPAVHMLEADLLMSRPPERASSSSGASASEVLMCHPPARESDLGFEDFMSDVIAALREGRRVGIKLDFKEIECVEAYCALCLFFVTSNVCVCLVGTLIGLLASFWEC